MCIFGAHTHVLDGSGVQLCVEDSRARVGVDVTLKRVSVCDKKRRAEET